jgi:hypothetical protein
MHKYYMRRIRAKNISDKIHDMPIPTILPEVTLSITCDFAMEEWEIIVVDAARNLS